MRKGTLARIEINIGLLAFAAMLALAGYALVASLADRIDPKVRDCIPQKQREAAAAGQPLSRPDAIRLCKHLEQVDGL